jgi:hypothetical protein
MHAWRMFCAPPHDLHVEWLASKIKAGCTRLCLGAPETEGQRVLLLKVVVAPLPSVSAVLLWKICDSARLETREADASIAGSKHAMNHHLRQLWSAIIISKF